MSGAFEDDDLDLRAAEYVIGTLDRNERAAFADRLDRDAGAKRSVTAWEDRFAGLAGWIDPIAPPRELWARIELALSATPSATMHPFKVIDGGGLGADAALRASRNRWRTGALLSGTIAAVLLLFVANRTLGPPSRDADATYVAAVNRGGDKPALIVRVNLKTGQVLVRPVEATTPPGHSLELWYIGTDKTPRSMGVVNPAAATLALPNGSGSETATFAISVEPPGGSKTGSPTGPVVYAGQLVKD